jgi:uncharacterized protein (TIGR02453 family)
MIFPGFRPQALTFLRQIKRNNRRDWFAERKDVYERELLDPMRLFVEEMDVRLASFAPEIHGSVKRSIFRIYRDTRFSKDKTPYKTHISCWFTHVRAGHGVGAETHGAGAGFYFHVEPGASLVAAGIWMPPRPSLLRIREHLAESSDAFEKTMNGRKFKTRFSALSEEKVLSRVPRGFAPDHPAAKWLRFCSFTVSGPLTDEQILSPKLPQQVEKDFVVLRPFVRWLNEALGYPAQEGR